MKTFVIVTLVIIAIMLANGEKLKFRDERPKEGSIIVYESCDYKGRNMEMCASNPNLGIEFGNMISALKIQSYPNQAPMRFISAKLYTEVSYKGNDITLSEDNRCIDSIYNDKINSIMIESDGVKPSEDIDRPKEGCIIVYEHCYYKGRSMEICASNPKLEKRYFDHIISSIKVQQYPKPSGYYNKNPLLRVKLFKDVFYEGDYKIILRDKPCFIEKDSLKDFNDRINSINLEVY
jgi:hypothetical protein